MNPNSFSQQGGPAMLAGFQNQRGQGSINPSQLMGGNPQQQHNGSINLNNLLQVAGITRDQFQALPRQEQQMLGAKYVQMAQQQQQQQQMLGMQQQQQGYDRPLSSASSHSQPQHMMPPPLRPPTAQGMQQQQMPGQPQPQHTSRPGTALSHRSPTIPGPMDGQRPGSGMAHTTTDGMMNGFKQGQTPGQPGQQQPFNPQQNSGGGQHQMQQTMQLNHANPYPPSTSPTRGAKRKVTGDLVGMPGNMNMQGMNPAMGMQGGMPNMNMNNNGLVNQNPNMMANMNMNPMSSNNSIGMPGSPRIGGPPMSGQGGMQGGMMGPPGLPRSISGDGMGGGNMMNMNMANLGGMGMNNNNNANNMNAMNMAMMNGARGSPRPQSSMGMNMNGMPPGMGNNNNNMGGINMAAMGMNVDSPMRPQHQQQHPQQHQQQHPQTIGIGGMSPQNMQGNPNMGMQGSISIGPQTPMRQGSLPPQTPQPQQQQHMVGMGMNMNMGGGGGGMGMGMGGMNMSMQGQGQGQMPTTPQQHQQHQHQHQQDLSRHQAQAMRQGSQPPSSAGGGGQPGMQRRSSIPPQGGVGVGNMGMSPMNIGGGGGGGNMGMGMANNMNNNININNVGNMGNMGMGMGGMQMQTPNNSGGLGMGLGPHTPSSPLVPGGGATMGGVGVGLNMGGLGGGLGGGGLNSHPQAHPHQAMSMAPSISASSMGSMSGGLGMGIVPPAPQNLGLSGGPLSASSSTLAGLGPSTALPTTSTTPSNNTPLGGLGGGSGGTSSSSASSAPISAASAAAAAANAAQQQLLASLPPLPANVTLNPHTTLITPVPLLTSLSAIPAVSPAEIEDVQGWMETDKTYELRARGMKMRAAEEVRAAFGLGGVSGGMWWERGGSLGPVGNGSRFRRREGERFDVRYPKRREPAYGMSGGGVHGRSSRRGVKREGLKLPRKIDAEDANRPEQLVPIRIEFDVEHHKMRDTFVWNLNDPIVSPEAFAQSIVEDYQLAPSYHSIIVKHIQDQLSDFKAHSGKYDPDMNELSDAEEPSALRGSLEGGGSDERWWAAWRKRVKSGRKEKEKGSKPGRKKRKTVVKKENDEDDEDARMWADNESEDADDDEDEDRGVWFEDDEAFKPLSVDEIKLDEQALHEDMRILIKLDIIVASIKLDDQFEWDLDNPMTSPEEFAEVYAQELGLGGEFKTAIAHSIREQIQTYQKSLFLLGHPSDGGPVIDDDLKQSFLPSLVSGARPVSEVQMFTPLLNYLSDGELERTEKERDKDLNKRRKRNTRGRRGIALPDREPIRTYRTPAIGFPELDAATLALAAAANAPMSRRAAAAAASLTIANMVASENGTAFMPQMPSAVPQPTPQAVQKEKKPKGLFKAPAYPSMVLRPRAHVHAPTPSTAADVSNMPPVPADSEAPRSSSSIAPPMLDSRASKVVTAKRAKELEREAKEKEFVDGQHPNYIDGVWHCSNCGCPDSIAVGRRKGPLGDKSQCGTCGKFWHRHRRPRPVEYNPDPSFHSNVKQKDTEPTRTPGNKKKGAAAALRAQSAVAGSATPADASEPQTPSRSNGDADATFRASPTPAAHMKDEDDRAISPVSTASSASEAPLAQKVKLNGNHSKTSNTPATPVKSQPVDTIIKTPAPESASAPAPTSNATPISPSRTWPPTWLSTQMQLMQTKYPSDRFEVILRKVNATSTPEWRIKCLDCPGKLYTPGPLETLSNYEVHLKNRQHRQRVNDRIKGTTTAAAPQ